MAEDHEVSVKLVVDDQSSATLNKVKQGLEDVAHGHEHAKDAAHEHAKEHGEAHEGFLAELKHSIMGGLGMGIGVVLAEKIGEGIHEIPEMMKEAFNEGVKAIEAQRSIAGVLTMTGAQGSFDQVLDTAKLYKESLQDIAIESGTAEATLISVFDGIAARSNKSAVEVEELTEKIAYAGKAVRGGPEAIASGFTMLEQGMVRARNPIVQLITSQHLLEGNARSVAKQMMKMTPDKQIELGEKAISKLSEKMKDAVPTFTQLKQSFEGMKEFALEGLGEPLVQAVVPHLNELKKYLLLHKNEIAAYAHDVGESLVEYGEKTLDFLKDVKGIVTGEKLASTEYDSWGDVLKGSIGFFKMAGEGAALAFHDTLGAVSSRITAGQDVEAAGLGGRGATGEAETLVTGRRAAAEGAQASAAMAYDPATALAAHTSLDAWQRWNDAIVKMGGHVNEAAVDTARAQLAAAEYEGQQLQMRADQHEINPLVQAYNIAEKSHNKALQIYAAHLIGGSTDLSKQLVESGIEISGGMAEFVRILKASGMGEAGDKLAKLAKEKGAKEAAHVTNFNGGQTFQIKQDFRDQDPDRIAVVFRQDILRAANSRVTSANVAPFGHGF